MGCGNGAKVSRYENFARKPTLETILAYRMILGTPVEDLFGGVFQKVEKIIAKRARVLAQKLSRLGPDNMAIQKIGVLEDIVSASRSAPADRR